MYVFGPKMTPSWPQLSPKKMGFQTGSDTSGDGKTSKAGGKGTEQMHNNPMFSILKPVSKSMGDVCIFNQKMQEDFGCQIRYGKKLLI